MLDLTTILYYAASKTNQVLLNGQQASIAPAWVLNDAFNAFIPRDDHK